MHDKNDFRARLGELISVFDFVIIGQNVNLLEDVGCKYLKIGWVTMTLNYDLRFWSWIVPFAQGRGLFDRHPVIKLGLRKECGLVISKICLIHKISTT